MHTCIKSFVGHAVAVDGSNSVEFVLVVVAVCDAVCLALAMPIILHTFLSLTFINHSLSLQNLKYDFGLGFPILQDEIINLNCMNCHINIFLTSKYLNPLHHTDTLDKYLFPSLIILIFFILLSISLLSKQKTKLLFILLVVTRGSVVLFLRSFDIGGPEIVFQDFIIALFIMFFLSIPIYDYGFLVFVISIKVVIAIGMIDFLTFKECSLNHKNNCFTPYLENVLYLSFIYLFNCNVIFMLVICLINYKINVYWHNYFISKNSKKYKHIIRFIKKILTILSIIHKAWFIYMAGNIDERLREMSRPDIIKLNKVTYASTWYASCLVMGGMMCYAFSVLLTSECFNNKYLRISPDAGGVVIMKSKRVNSIRGRPRKAQHSSKLFATIGHFKTTYYSNICIKTNDCNGCFSVHFIVLSALPQSTDKSILFPHMRCPSYDFWEMVMDHSHPV
ncbi:hypothetical protein QTP88_022596 [Uroleucon formosanum]